MIKAFVEFLHGLTPREGATAAVDVLVVAYVIYRVLLLLKGTRAAQMLIGLALVAGGFFVAKAFELTTLSWLLDNLINYSIIFLIVIFQYDIRRGLVRVGRNLFSAGRQYEETYVFEEVIRAAEQLARSRVGALIVFEREADLEEFISQPGEIIDARVTKELLVSLFLPLPINTLHDGAVVIKGLRLFRAGCVLPLSANPKLDKSLGTRHRAAVGITEETDAVVVVVSEGRGTVSLCFGGNVALDLEPAMLRKALLGLFRKEKRTAPVRRAAPVGETEGKREERAVAESLTSTSTEKIRPSGPAVGAAIVAEPALLASDVAPELSVQALVPSNLEVKVSLDSASMEPAPVGSASVTAGHGSAQGGPPLMRDFLRRALFENALLKALALVLAFVLFVAVRADKDAVSGVYFKVVYVFPKERVLVSETVPELRVSVRGPLTRVSRLDEHDLPEVRVNLADATEGDLRFSEEMVHLPPGLHVASISPPSLKLRFEARAERNVPIQPIIEGEPAAGYRVVRSAAVPKSVLVTGAKSVVDGIARAPTMPLRIADTRENLRSQIELAPAPPHAEWRPHSPITVEVTVEQALAERILKEVAVRVVGASRLEARVEPETAEVVLRGPAEALAQVPPGTPSLLVDAQAEDSHPPGAFRKRISVAGLPSGVAAEVRPESITLVTRRRRD